MKSLPFTTQRFGKKIRQLRQKNNWSLTQLEKISGINRNYLTKIEKGTAKKVKLSHAIELSRSFDITLKEILTFTE